MKILQIYNSAAHYRESIFLLMDKTFDCNYVFGESLGDIKQMDTSKFRGCVTIVKNRFFRRGFYWQIGVQHFLSKDYDAYILSGDTRCLSTWWFCLRAKLSGRSKRIYFWTHGWYGKETSLERWLKRRFFKMAGGGIFLYGNYARELMIKEGFDSKKLYVIHNSLAYDRQIIIRKQLHKDEIYQQHFYNQLPNLIFVGRLTQVKKIDMVLKAMALLKNSGEECNFTIIGDGDTRQELETLAKELGLEKTVWFYGACYDEEQLGHLIYNADLCVSPGNVGLTAMHVMVFGTPVITHNDFPYQMPEFEAIHEGKTGTYFERDKVDSLADAIQNWLKSRANKREEVRKLCFHEIDTQWTPAFQIKVLMDHLNNSDENKALI